MTQPSTVSNTTLGERYSAARSALSTADPVMALLIQEHPDFDPRAFLAQLPKMDAFGTLLFQIIGQQLSVVATRAILNRLESLFGGRLPTPRELLDIDAQRVHAAGLSKRKVKTMRALAQAFVSGDLDDDTLAVTSDAEIEAKLIAIPGIGPWTVNGFLLIALDRPDPPGSRLQHLESPAAGSAIETRQPESAGSGGMSHQTCGEPPREANDFASLGGCS